MILDSEHSSISPAKITVFCVRPPELTFVHTLENYFTWFLRFRMTDKSVPESFLNVDVSQSYWIWVHYSIESHLYKTTNPIFLQQCKEALQCVNGPHVENFLAGKTASKQVQIVFSNIIPRDTANF